MKTNIQRENMNDEIKKDIESVKEIGSAINLGEEEFKKKIAEIEKEISRESKNISDGLLGLDKEEEQAEKDFEKLMLENAEKIAQEEKEEEEE